MGPMRFHGPSPTSRPSEPRAAAPLDDRLDPAVAAALLMAGYRALGPVGRGSGGPAWSATSLDEPGLRVVVRVVDLAPDPRREARLHRLAGVSHPHLARLVAAVPVPPSRCALLVEHVPGPTLEALREARGPLTSGEAVTVAVPLADALDALHAAGLVHGDVSPANVIVRPDGRPVLVDLQGAVVDSGGTAGFAAPELENGVEPTAASDVHALAQTILAQLPPDRPPGTPSAELTELRAVLAEASTPEQEARPGARAFGDACFRVDEAEPIGLPDPSVLARTELARLAARPGARSTTRPGAVVRGRGASRHRAPRRWRGPAARLAVVVAAVGLAGSGALALSGLGREADALAQPPAVAQPPATASPVLTAPAPDPVAAAVALTTARVEAITSGDSARLDAVEEPGSPAHVADTRLLAELAEQGVRVEGLQVQVHDARRVVGRLADVAGASREESAPAQPTAWVEVTSTLSPHRRVGVDGAVVQEVAPSGPTAVVLVMRLTGAGWRVAEVEVSPHL